MKQGKKILFNVLILTMIIGTLNISQYAFAGFDNPIDDGGTQTTTFRGFVLDQFGNAISSATVRIKENSVYIATTTTSSSGYFSITKATYSTKIYQIVASKTDCTTATSYIGYVSSGTYTRYLYLERTIYTTFRGFVLEAGGFNEPLIGAVVKLYKNNILIQTTYAAFEAEYYFSAVADLGSTQYVIKASFTGYDTATYTVYSRTYTSTYSRNCYLNNRVMKYAVIVGISDYKERDESEDLKYCDEDASDWYNHFNSAGFDYITVLGDNHPENYPKYDGLATEANIVAALINMIELADENDIIVFTFSGHGLDPINTYLCTWENYAYDGRLYDSELQTIFNEAIAAKIFVFLDNCRSGGIGDNLMDMDNSENVYCATTCMRQGRGYDDDIHYNGCWTYYFLEYSWQNHFSSSFSVSMEDVFAYAYAAYPWEETYDQPQEFDGNLAEDFYLM